MPVLTVPIGELAGIPWGVPLSGWVETNADAIRDSGSLKMGSPPLVFNGTTATVTLPATTGEAANVVYRVWVKWTEGDELGAWRSEWFSLTADASLFDLAATTVNGTYPTLAEAIAAADEAETYAAAAQAAAVDAENAASTATSAGRLVIGTVATGDPGTAAEATITGTSGAQSLNLTLPQGPEGRTGDKGDTGATGPANTLTIGVVLSGAAAAATITGTAPNQTLNLALPKGDKGDTGGQGIQGLKGDTGATGPANTLAVGSVTTGAVGANASATITGTAPNQTLNLTLPRGATGNTGQTGPANTLTVGVVNTGANASATITGNAPNQTLDLTLPYGPANTLTIGTVNSDVTPAATITGTAPNQTLNLTLPKGDKGDAGSVDSVNGDTGPDVVLTAASVGAVAVADLRGDFASASGVATSAPTAAFAASTYDGLAGLMDGRYVAASATKLATARTIAGKLFDGTANISIAAADVGAPPTARLISPGTGLTGGGDLSADRTLSVVFGTAVGTAAQGNDARITGAVQSSLLGVANGVATLAADGTLVSSQLPSLALTDTRPVASQAEMLALSNVQPGDLAIRTDGAGTFILSGTPASTLSNWTLLSAPTDAVLSVQGQTGTVNLAAADVGAAPVGRQIIAGSGLSGGGDLSADRSLAVAFGTAAGTAAQGNDSRITSAVPNTRMVNGKALSGDITLTATDVGAFTAAGGIFTGRVRFAAMEEAYVSPAVAATTTLNCSTVMTHRVVLTANTTLSITGLDAATGVSQSVNVMLVQDATGGRTVTWPSGTKWAGAVAPLLTTTANSVCFVTLTTFDAGTTWYGFPAGMDMR